jgi:type I restriction enzyme S subunit
VVSIIAAGDHRLVTEVNTLEKLHLLKKGLLDDLLTGRVRVTCLLDEAAA